MRTTESTISSVYRRLFSSIAFALSLTAVTAARVQAGDVTLVETGSTLLYPLFNIWVANYTKTHQGISIATNATGSEAGIEKDVSGEAQIGASDVFMSDKEVRQNPQILNIPLCISAQMVNYNLPGLKAEKLKLDGTVRGWVPGRRRTSASTSRSHRAKMPIRSSITSRQSFQPSSETQQQRLRSASSCSGRLCRVKLMRVISITSISSPCRRISGS
jgi:PBP superfamily domain